MLLCVGVLLTKITFHSSADSYTVNAEILAPIPTEPAIITSPPDQSHFTTRPIEVSGTCPSKSYVILSRSGAFSGSAICGDNQTTFQIETDLSLGSNILNAQVYNVTGQAGPSSPSITVYYANPASPSPAASGSSTSSSSQEPSALINPNLPPFFITSNFKYTPHFIEQPFNLNVTLNGGVAPFAVNISWGDGTNSTFERQDDSEFNAPHTYTDVKSNDQAELVKIQAVDKQGSTAYLEVSELVCRQTCPNVAPAIMDTANPFITNAKRWARFIWPSYLLILIIVVAFYLGERQEYYNLTSRKFKSHPRRS